MFTTDKRHLEVTGPYFHEEGGWEEGGKGIKERRQIRPKRCINSRCECVCVCSESIVSRSLGQFIGRERGGPKGDDRQGQRRNLSSKMHGTERRSTLNNFSKVPALVFSDCGWSRHRSPRFDGRRGSFGKGERSYRSMIVLRGNGKRETDPHRTWPLRLLRGHPFLISMQT